MTLAFVRSPEQRWRRCILDSLIETTIARDVLLQSRVDKPAMLRRLFELRCRYSGQILSCTKMLGQLQDAGNTTTLAHYLDLLAGVGLRPVHSAREQNPNEDGRVDRVGCSSLLWEQLFLEFALMIVCYRANWRRPSIEAAVLESGQNRSYCWRFHLRTAYGMLSVPAVVQVR